jgi:hypothetical protein
MAELTRRLAELEEINAELLEACRAAADLLDLALIDFDNGVDSDETEIEWARGIRYSVAWSCSEIVEAIKKAEAVNAKT